MLVYPLPAWVRKLPHRMAILETHMDNLLSQIDDLNSGLDSIAADVANAVQHLNDLEAELKALQDATPPEVDLSGPLARVAAIRSELEPAPAPADPAPEAPTPDAPAA